MYCNIEINQLNLSIFIEAYIINYVLIYAHIQLFRTPV